MNAGLGGLIVTPCREGAVIGAATTGRSGVEDGVIVTLEMYEIIVGRELCDEETILVTPDPAADADRAAFLQRDL